MMLAISIIINLFLALGIITQMEINNNLQEENARLTIDKQKVVNDLIRQLLEENDYEEGN